MSEIITEHQKVLLRLLEEFDRVCKKYHIPYILFAGSALGVARHKGFIPWDDDIDIAMLRKDYEQFLRVAQAEVDSERFFLQKEFSEHWPCFFSKLRMNNTACIERCIPKDDKLHQGIYIDIFPVDNLSDGKLRRRIQFLASKVVIAKSLDRRGYLTDSRKKKIFMVFCRVLPLKPMLQLAKNVRNTDSKWVHSFFGAASKYAKNVFERTFFTERTEADFEDLKVPVSAHNHALLSRIYGDYMTFPSIEEIEEKIHGVIVDTERSYEHYIEEQKKMKFDRFTRSIR